LIGKLLLSKYTRGAISEDPLDSIRVLLSDELAQQVRDSRAFSVKSCGAPSIARLHALAIADTNTYVEYAAHEDTEILELGIVYVYYIHSDAGEILKKCIDFSSPLVRRAFLMYYRACNTLVPTTIVYTVLSKNIKEFMLDVLSYWRKSAFIDSFSKGVRGNIREAKFQDEFYYVARSLLLNEATVDPEVGSIFGFSKLGGIDIYINSSLSWGFEFLVEGSRLLQHFRRFMVGGNYERYPLRSKIVVNFVRTELKALTPEIPSGFDSLSYLTVCYTDRFDKMCIYDKDNQWVIPFKGDEM
jgi:hypothetical protein